MKRITTLLCSLALAASGAVMTAPAASADTHKCVTRTEYKAVERGWSKERVHRKFDVKGTYSYGDFGYQGRDYNACGRYNGVSVYYEKRNGVWRVDDKFGYF